MNGSSQFEERVGGRLDAVDARNGEVLLPGRGVGQDLHQFKGADVDLLAGFGPEYGGIVDRVLQ